MLTSMIDGFCQRAIHRGEDGLAIIFRVNTGNEKTKKVIIDKGSLHMQEGERIVIRQSRTYYNKKYNEEEFRTELKHCHVLPPDSIEAYIVFLKNLGPGMTKERAESFFATWKEEGSTKDPFLTWVYNRLPGEPIRDLLEKYNRELQRKQNLENLFSTCNITITTEKFQKIVSTKLSFDDVRSNPYKLSAEGLLSIRHADIVASHEGLLKDFRAKEVVTQLFTQVIEGDMGNTYGERVEIVPKIQERVKDEQYLELFPHLETAVEWAIANGRLKQESERLFRPETFQLEQDVATIFAKLMGSRQNHTRRDKGRIPSIQGLTDDQERVVRGVFAKNAARLTVLTGGPGCGKSYTIQYVNTTAQRLQYSICLTASTGKAAQRIGPAAKTLHSFLRSLEKCRAPDILVVDEASMVDLELMVTLLESIHITKTHLILVGDPNQLPPIGLAQPFQDLITFMRQVGSKALFELKTVKRQEDQSLIVQAAHGILCGFAPVGPKYQDPDGDFYFRQLQAGENLLEVVGSEYKALTQTFGEKVSIVTPTTTVKEELNTLVKSFTTEVPLKKVVKGDKVMQLKNIKDEDGTNLVSNGSVGYATVLRSKSFDVQFDERTMTFPYGSPDEYPTTMSVAYASTVHKMQGSEG